MPWYAPQSSRVSAVVPPILLIKPFVDGSLGTVPLGSSGAARSSTASDLAVSAYAGANAPRAVLSRRDLARLSDALRRAQLPGVQARVALAELAAAVGATPGWLMSVALGPDSAQDVFGSSA